ncbi:MAG: CZB domain-containing protein [Defluviitaleaceae bacterium]|nr:CZB domain-containing protein [Defluviitaleaceae bacterium]
MVYTEPATASMGGLLKDELLNKGEADLRSGITNLLNVQSSMLSFITMQSVDDLKKRFEDFRQNIKDISGVSAKINSLSYRSRILSINAAVEAAHAGAAGKGFGVVAEEISTLSDQTTKCTAEVNEINKTMLADLEVNLEAVSSLHDTMRDNLVSFESFTGKLESESGNIFAIEENGFVLTILGKRLENHADFISKLMTNAGNGHKIADHNNCAFGKWYNANMDKYRNIPGYAEIYDTHKAFHDEAAIFNETLDAGALAKMVGISRDLIEKFVFLAQSFKSEMLNDDSYFQI